MLQSYKMGGYECVFTSPSFIVVVLGLSKKTWAESQNARWLVHCQLFCLVLKYARTSCLFHDLASLC